MLSAGRLQPPRPREVLRQAKGPERAADDGRAHCDLSDPASHGTTPSGRVWILALIFKFFYFLNRLIDPDSHDTWWIVVVLWMGGGWFNKLEIFHYDASTRKNSLKSFKFPSTIQSSSSTTSISTSPFLPLILLPFLLFHLLHPIHQSPLCSLSPSCRLSRPSGGSPSTWTPEGGRATGDEPRPRSEAKAEARSGHCAGQHSSSGSGAASPPSCRQRPPAATFPGPQVLVLVPDRPSSLQVCGGLSGLLARDL